MRRRRKELDIQVPTVEITGTPKPDLIRPYEACSNPTVTALHIWYDMIIENKVELNNVVQLLHNLPHGRTLELCISLLKNGISDNLQKTLPLFMVRNLVKQFSELDNIQVNNPIFQALENLNVEELLKHVLFEVDGYSFIFDQWLAVVKQDVRVLDDSEYALERKFGYYILYFNVDGKTQSVKLSNARRENREKTEMMESALERMRNGNKDFKRLE